MKKNKRITGKWRLFLLMVIIIGIQPVFGQQNDSKSASGTKSLDLDLGLASDDELIQALNQAADIEIINKEDNLTAESVPTEKTPANAERETSDEISDDNEYLQESRRLAKLAEEAFAEGDYDTSAKLAGDAAYSAKRSDVLVAIATAKSSLDQAAASGVSARFSTEYREAENLYKQSTNARDNEEWEIAINAANMVVQLLDGLETSGGPAPLPATYTVRPWSVSKDCFWNIAAQSWAYGNPHQWRRLYNANRSKLPNPNNPNVIDPGTVLDIPSIKNELRQGAWDSARTYEPFK